MEFTAYELYEQVAFYLFRFGGFTMIMLLIGLAALMRNKKFDRWFGIMAFV